MRYPRFVALVLGVFLSVCFTTTTASAASLEPNQEPCTVPCEKTFTFVPDPGVVYDLAWDPDRPDGVAPRRVVTTTCSAEQPEGCRLTWRYETAGGKSVDVVANGELYFTGFQANSNTPVVAPIAVSGPSRMKLPGDVLTVTTGHEMLQVDWKCPDNGLTGRADVTRLGSNAGRNTFRVVLHAPARCRLRVEYGAITENGGFSSAQDSRFVESYRAPALNSFGLTYDQPRQRLRPQLWFRAQVPAVWKVQTEIRRRVRGQWRTLERLPAQSGSIRPFGAQKYARFVYGKSKRLSTRARAAACQGTAQVVLRATVRRSGQKYTKRPPAYSKTVVRKLPPTPECGSR